MSSPENWARISRIDAIISLAAAGVPAVMGLFEGVPWTYRFPAMVVSACGVLYLWRHLTLRRMLMPSALQKHYENDLLTMDELFKGRSRVSNITFRNTEFRGPGAMYLRENCRVTNPLYSPHINTLAVMPQSYASLLPFYHFDNCVFDKCVFNSVGLLIDSTNNHLFGLPDPQEPTLPFQDNPPSPANLDEKEPLMPNRLAGQPDVAR